MRFFAFFRSTTKEKNQLREVIKELFRERDCVTIVRPVADEAELRNIQNVDYEKLRPQFRTQVEAVKGFRVEGPREIQWPFGPLDNTMKSDLSFGFGCQQAMRC